MLNRCISVVFMCVLVGGCTAGGKEYPFGFDVLNRTRANVSVRLFDPTAEYDVTENVVVLGPLGQYRHATIYTKDTSVVVRRWNGDEGVGPTLEIPIEENAMVNVIIGHEDGELVLEKVETVPWEW